ncbi:MAG TPA: radical SAM protein, partial [Bradyrhizobium sp.]|nr:radical SAM protein [Bradyrhizobium sp.]
MSRASSAALKHPPVTAPSEPAGALSPFPELELAIERERRRGRGAQSNESGRFEAEARVAFDDGWQSLDELPPFKTTVAVDTARKVITRNDS